MATAHTALQMMREVCLSLPSTVEAEHFGEVCFRVNKRIFASCGEKEGVCRLIFQLEPEHARRIVASDPQFQPYPRQKNCVWVDAAVVDGWDEVRELVLESYRLNESANQPAKKTRIPRRTKKERE